MPIYDYQCSNGHSVEELRKVDDRNNELKCQECGEPMILQIQAPHFGVLNMGCDSGFPTFYEKWGKMQEQKNRGKTKDANNRQNSDKTMSDAGLL